jgi:hypothetical protein
MPLTVPNVRYYVPPRNEYVLAHWTTTPPTCCTPPLPTTVATVTPPTSGPSLETTSPLAAPHGATTLAPSALSRSLKHENKNQRAPRAPKCRYLRTME